MNSPKVSLIVFLLLGFMCVSAPAQDSKSSDRKPAPVIWDESREPKDQVEEHLAAAKKRGEIVLGTCIDGCDDRGRELPEGFERGRAIKLPTPAYPVIARKANVSGSVEVKVLIDVDGKVIAAVAISGHPLLYATSAKAARDSVFSPTKWEGQPVKVTGVIKYNFVAQ